MKQAGYLDTKDLDAIQYNYIFNNSNNINTEKSDTDTTENIDLKKIVVCKKAAINIVEKYKNLARKKPYSRQPPQVAVDVPDDEVGKNEDTINDLDAIANLQPGRNAQIAAKVKNIKK